MGTRHLDIFYDFIRKELKIRFFSPEQALSYQARNHEARIFESDDKSVWLPIPDSMTCLRASALGFVIRFKDSDAAVAWCRHSVLGRLHPRDNTDVYIQREWNEVQLSTLLSGTKAGGLPPAKDTQPPPRSPRAQPTRILEDMNFGIPHRGNLRDHDSDSDNDNRYRHRRQAWG
jgi:hypothetical protein